MWLTIYHYYYIVYLKQLKYKNFSTIYFQKNWFFFNTEKKTLRLFILLKLILTNEELFFFKQQNKRFLTTPNPFLLFRFYIFFIPSTIRQIIDPKILKSLTLSGLVLNSFFQITNLSRRLFFLTTFKKLKIIWTFQRALLVK